ncbi:Tex family protein [Chitinimonas sp. BJB300]|uniref:Tex family protein n=1 Tax=Chitinimonas sp. BJB300 TaxID=1559339 RepID=UPI000C11A215|nr:Tex family protein [Chitinimonas sp. BJB300]PHV12944.1 RNA-binding transcriptional accessory protein [Chitinimonas sp. BJB300]TSJ89103.1 RNA-binding transcriptional accessory protein [Chitinimonas sp. BJB300]
MLPTIENRLAQELNCRPNQVAATVTLLDEGATVPFIARYRKEVTGGLDDTQLRLLEERLRYLRELEDRRVAVISSVQEQGKLTPELHAAFLSADNKQRLEDLYLPYKQKRRTRAQIAREAGLAPLAEALLANPVLNPETEAAAYVSEEKAVPDVKAALDGARYILIEQYAEDAGLLGELRELLWSRAELVVSLADEAKREEGAKFADYFDHREPLAKTPSHRALAILRGRNEGILNFTLALPEDADLAPGRQSVGEGRVALRFNVRDQGRAADRWLLDGVRLAWRAKIFLSLEVELTNRIREAAEVEAIKVFASNLKDLLLAAPAGPRATLGLDPGLRTGVKVAVVDNTGKLVATDTIYPHVPRNDWDGSLHKLAKLAAAHKVELIAIGNGTASRETDKLAAELIKLHPEFKMQKIVVSEAGASVYSASELAAKEFPELDVSLRGAVSIARRLQDPLAELVKIDPKAIGVGQYQHDLNQGELARSLDAVVEDCVNAVGVDVNMASSALLARVSGLTPTLAGNIVAHRDTHGAFASRAALKAVPRLGEKTFEQAAGFLRVMNGDNPLDASSVHPEAYPVVEKILAKSRREMKSVLGDSSFLKQLNAAEFTDERFGLPTVKDILAELDKPGRDPRPEFKTATFQEGVEDIKDLRLGMILEGVVSNVAAFGAFVDIGVHQDGLVHVSALANKFVKDPRDVVKAGDVVRVKVMEVDVKRARIALTMRLEDQPGAAGSGRPAQAERPVNPTRQRTESKPAPAGDNAMAAAFAALKRK